MLYFFSGAFLVSGIALICTVVSSLKAAHDNPEPNTDMRSIIYPLPVALLFLLAAVLFGSIAIA